MGFFDKFSDKITGKLKNNLTIVDEIKRAQQLGQCIKVINTRKCVINLSTAPNKTEIVNFRKPTDLYFWFDSGAFYLGLFMPDMILESTSDSRIHNNPLINSSACYIIDTMPTLHQIKFEVSITNGTKKIFAVTTVSNEGILITDSLRQWSLLFPFDSYCWCFIENQDEETSLFEDFINIHLNKYQNEYGSIKLQEIVSKILDSSKALHFAESYAANLIIPDTLTILAMLNEIPFFIFSSKNVTAIGAIISLILVKRSFSKQEILIDDDVLISIAKSIFTYLELR